MSTLRQIQSLRKERLRLIENCDFDQAEVLEKRINDIIQEREAHNDQLVVDLNHSKYNIEKENIRTESNEIHNTFKTRAFEIHGKFQKRRRFLQEAHANYLAQLATKYANDLELESTRIVVQTENLISEAKKRAQASDYAEAKRLYAQATQIKEQTMAERQASLKQKYDQIIQQAEQKNAEELEALDKKEQEALAMIQSQYDKEMKNLDTKLSASSVRLGTARNMEDEQRMFHKLEFDFPSSRTSAETSIKFDMSDALRRSQRL
ncbi:hypothetical protein TVAG_199040 [Trichomonas vaginalis G3]|uniref:Uncharacterized protein n=1 Tax=Trichomonas vaginalis (strain ATCC PRA-98 / G3) TaxID=412133 RepID=A2DDT9_TRIV3|nr:hypothetical protein TVAGG3_0999540 [Trichomonas vaginalis G3]EAY21465.1 hypothetical protein TVAG_199040 [Trichomonas vaginalis G3]KAI5490678.1 hypothetical protein TVAGG3_0999540 [Trichomonas vaginalis G3]|eukprot:XP_001582451.1 hypothetical protein [Trichomonas vaginalis G3]